VWCRGEDKRRGDNILLIAVCVDSVWHCLLPCSHHGNISVPFHKHHPASPISGAPLLRIYASPPTPYHYTARQPFVPSQAATHGPVTISPSYHWALVVGSIFSGFTRLRCHTVPGLGQFLVYFRFVACTPPPRPAPSPPPARHYPNLFTFYLTYACPMPATPACAPCTTTTQLPTHTGITLLCLGLIFPCRLLHCAAPTAPAATGYRTAAVHTHTCHA